MWQWVLFFTLVYSNTDAYNKVCQCIQLTSTKGNEWGYFEINSSNIHISSTECIMIFIIGSSSEIIELEFLRLQMRKGCEDEIKIFAHLKEPVLTDSIPHDDKICEQNSIEFITEDLEIDEYKKNENISMYVITDMNRTIFTQQLNNKHIKDRNQERVYNFTLDQTESKEFQPRNFKSIYSSDRVLVLQFFYDEINRTVKNQFEIVGKFRYLDKFLFKIDGDILPTTFCDYQFLPHPINYAEEYKYKNSLWRYFYSPRYPAKYPGHVKCSYKFIGRPKNIVEIFFDEISLQNTNKSCIYETDKITIYDSKLPEKSAILDVFCNEKYKTRITSSGQNLLIEFDTSLKKSSFGFSGKYKFIEIEDKEPHQSSINTDLTCKHNSYINNHIYEYIRSKNT